MTLKEYMQGHEVAVKQLFNSLTYYHDLIKKTIPPSFDSDMVSLNEYVSEDYTEEEIDKAIEEAYRKYYNEHSEFRKQQEDSNMSWQKYKANILAHASVCGSILQIAHMAISRFSKYTGECLVLDRKYKKFGAGRLVNNVPLGLVIYAGRNQYNHWDEEAKPKTKELFDLIATKNNLDAYKDPCFDLDYKKLQIYSHNVFGLIGWESYEDYEKDMFDMLSEYTE